MKQVTTEEGTNTYDYDENGRGVKRSTPGGIERGTASSRVGVILGDTADAVVAQLLKPALPLEDEYEDFAAGDR